MPSPYIIQKDRFGYFWDKLQFQIPDGGGFRKIDFLFRLNTPHISFDHTSEYVEVLSELLNIHLLDNSETHNRNRLK